MWAIFIVLFGGLYWAFKIGGERAQSRETDRMFVDWKNRYDIWCHSIHDEELNARTMRMVETEEGFQVLKDRAQRIIRQIPGLEYADIGCRISSAARHAVRFFEMVTHGKLPHGDERWLSSSLWTCIDLEFSMQAKVELARWIEKTMQQNGQQNAHLYCKTIEHDVVFEWESHMSTVDGAISLNDPGIRNIVYGDRTDVVESRNAARIKAKQQKERYDKWTESVCGGEMQAFLGIEFDVDHWQSVCASTLSFIRQLPGLEAANYWIENKRFPNSCNNLIFLIEMVKRGKLPANCFIGIPDEYLCNTVDLYIPRSAKIAFAQWIEQTLKEHGVTDAELYYRQHFNPSFVWKSSLVDCGDAIRITDHKLPELMTGESEELIAARNKPIIQQRQKE